MPSRTAIRNLMRMIRNGDLEAVEQAISSEPAFVNCTASSPPRRDDGQSPLQIAFKAKQLEIARLLIDQGADVNFHETSTVNEWTAPVLHDALTAAVGLMPVLRAGDTGERFEQAVELVRLLLARGADPNARDSYGNSCLDRVVLGLNNWRGSFRKPQYDQQVARPGLVLLSSLLQHGADPEAAHPRRRSTSEAVRESYPWFDDLFEEAVRNTQQ